jgi:hypothetical protein
VILNIDDYGGMMIYIGWLRVWGVFRVGIYVGMNCDDL